MAREKSFKRHRCPAVIILCAVPMYLRYPLSYQDTADLLAECGVHVDHSLSSAKATLSGIEAIRTIKNRHIYDMKPGVQGEIYLVHEVFGLTT